MASEPKLKPCPFCGDKAVMTKASRIGQKRSDIVIHCRRAATGRENCPARWGCSIWAQSQSAAIRRWNTRKGEKRRG